MDSGKPGEGHNLSVEETLGYPCGRGQPSGYRKRSNDAEPRRGNVVIRHNLCGSHVRHSIEDQMGL